MTLKKELYKKISGRLEFIYSSNFPNELFRPLIREIEKTKSCVTCNGKKWSEKDIILITYANSIKKEKEKPLKTLYHFLDRYIGNIFTGIHILPFFPYSSDDGFSVIDYRKVDPELGRWDDIAEIAVNYSLMCDLVINHVSQKNKWFQNFLKGKGPWNDYFIEVDAATDLSAVIRPRSLPLLSVFNTSEGEKYVWSTFSSDQIDLNFNNPKVLAEMIRILLFYISKGARIIRLDAIAFLWKEPGTNCLHRPQVHEIVKLMKDIVSYIDSSIILITETNVPNLENISYFGNGDEADMVYQFSLPPLLLHALNTANSTFLTQWASDIPEIPSGCSFFNFTASHDGIGMRPLEGILPAEEIIRLSETMKDYGGLVSTKRNSDGTDSPYELNITYLDALKYTLLGEDSLQIDRFICSQTIMMSMKGMPAFYIHSLLGTRNYTEGVISTGMNRTINRARLNSEKLFEKLRTYSESSIIFNELLRRIKIRKTIQEFHPESKQTVIDAGPNFFIIKRGTNSEFIALANITPTEQMLPADIMNYPFDKYSDLLSKQRKQKSIFIKPYQVLWLKKKKP